MITVTIERKGSTKKVTTLLSNGFTHAGAYDYTDTSLEKLGPLGFGTQMQVWTKQDGQAEITAIKFDQLV